MNYTILFTLCFLLLLDSCEAFCMQSLREERFEKRAKQVQESEPPAQILKFHASQSLRRSSRYLVEPGSKS